MGIPSSSGQPVSAGHPEKGIADVPPQHAFAAKLQEAKHHRRGAGKIRVCVQMTNNAKVPETTGTRLPATDKLPSASCYTLCARPISSKMLSRKARYWCELISRGCGMLISTIR